MQLSLAFPNHIPQIMGIIHDAQVYLASLKIDQWQDGYPDKNQIVADIKNAMSYVLFNEMNVMIATTVFTTVPEPTYTVIEGEWLTPGVNRYGVIHRMAVKKEHRNEGVAQWLFENCEQQLMKSGVPSMRIDTHEDNKGMQRLLQKRDYTYCGIITLDSGDKRLAFEKVFN